MHETYGHFVHICRVDGGGDTRNDTPKRTHVGDGLWTSRIFPSPSALRSATSPAGRGKNASMWVWWMYVLAPPLGELSPQVTDTRPQAGVHSAPCRRQV